MGNVGNGGRGRKLHLNLLRTGRRSRFVRRCRVRQRRRLGGRRGRGCRCRRTSRRPALGRRAGLVRYEPVLPLILRQHLLSFGALTREQQDGPTKSHRCEKTILQH